MKSLKQKLSVTIALSVIFLCANNAYAEINTAPVHDTTYNDEVVLKHEWQLFKDEYQGAEKRNFKFNKGLTVDAKNGSTGNAIYFSSGLNIKFDLGEGTNMNLRGADTAIQINKSSALTINGNNANLYFGNQKWDEYNSAANIYLDEDTTLNITAGSLTTAGGAETNLKLFDNAKADIELTGDFTSDAGGTAIAMENYDKNSNTNLTINANNITLGTTDLASADRQAGLYLLAYYNDGDNKLDVNLKADKALTISGFSRGSQTFGSPVINLQGKNINVNADSDSNGIGISLNSYNAVTPSKLTAVGDNITIAGTAYGIYEKDRAITNLNAKDTLKILSGSWSIVTNGSTVNAQAEKAINITGTVWTSGGNIIIGKASDSLQTTINGDLTAKDNGSINAYVNNAPSVFTGNANDYHWDEVENKTINGIHLQLNNGSVWNNLDYDSCVQALDTSNATVNMHDNVFNSLYIGNLSGNKTNFNMDIDAGTNANNSDRLYIAGTHTGEHYITLNNVNADDKIDGANGTVLVSVNNEQGKFFANDHEGSLYWKRYILDNKKSETTGYNTDWYLKEVQVIPATPVTPATPLPSPTPLEPAKPRPTTSVYAINTCMELGFDSWIEDNKLMQRMGDLRHKTGNDAGVWVRSKGGKFHHDDYKNSYTAYQLGYDSIAKRTQELTRYQGVAFAYNDGHSSFNRGSGKNKAKSIAFYSTDMRNKGHYLDLGFKIYNADSNFTVYDTLGKKITGSYDNTGISLSAEYGRKKHLDERWSIEPQAQLTLGFLGGANYTTSNGIHVSQSDATTALGRIGCNLVYDIDKKTDIYFKANWLHQFAGNYGASLFNDSESLRIDNHEHSTWLEYGLGIACQADKDKHFYADIERSSGGSVKEDWQWNVGMIWSF